MTNEEHRRWALEQAFQRSDGTAPIRNILRDAAALVSFVEGTPLKLPKGSGVKPGKNMWKSPETRAKAVERGRQLQALLRAKRANAAAVLNGSALAQ